MPDPLHIAAIVPYPVYPAKMGGQKGIALFYKFLGKKADVTMLTVKNQGEGDFSGRFLPVLGQVKLRYINPLLFFRLKRIITELQTTHLILEHPYFGWLGILLKRACNIKLVVHSHNIESLRFKSTGRWWWKILRKYEQHTHRNADINFFITDEDKRNAIANFGLLPSRCHTITYGFDLDAPPLKEERTSARDRICRMHNIKPEEKILFFNGTLDYKPNLDAVDIILNHINPVLKEAKDFTYKIIICGKNLPVHYNKLEPWSGDNIIYAGFVEDITDYFKAADIFINPVHDGGGIKTKLVEALGYNVHGVSTVSGAIGIPVNLTGSKLVVCNDGDWKNFADKIINADLELTIPPSFFEHFYWGNIAGKALAILKNDQQL